MGLRMLRRAGGRCVCTPALSRGRLSGASGGQPLPPCPGGWVSKPSDSGIGSAFGKWLGLQYRQAHGISSYLLIDWWLYGSSGQLGTVVHLVRIDPFVFGALQARPDWVRRWTSRTDILASDADEVYEIKPIRGADAGPAQLAGYLDSLRALAPRAPDWMGSRERRWRGGTWEPDPYLLPMPGASPTDVCLICTWRDQSADGVLLYDLLCCDSAHKPPVWVPKEAWDKIRDRIADYLKRLGRAIEDLGVGKIVVVAALLALAFIVLFWETLPIGAALARLLVRLIPSLAALLGGLAEGGRPPGRQAAKTRRAGPMLPKLHPGRPAATNRQRRTPPRGERQAAANRRSARHWPEPTGSRSSRTPVRSHRTRFRLWLRWQWTSCERSLGRRAPTRERRSSGSWPPPYCCTRRRISVRLANRDPRARLRAAAWPPGTAVLDRSIVVQAG